jgi:hypothetical protein
MINDNVFVLKVNSFIEPKTCLLAVLAKPITVYSRITLLMTLIGIPSACRLKFRLTKKASTLFFRFSFFTLGIRKEYRVFSLVKRTHYFLSILIRLAYQLPSTMAGSSGF